MRQVECDVQLADDRILRLIGEQPRSPSHDRVHTDLVLSLARQLMATYGGDPVVITLAVRLHDLGRATSSMHGKHSVLRSCRMARGILRKAGIDRGIAARVIEAIADHDDPVVRPRSLEGCILREADFLAGFGAWGILRSCMWSGESREGVDGAIGRLAEKMPARAESLEFPQSRRYADRQMSLVRLFLAQLEAEPVLADSGRRGLYIAFEGISGSGKSTQLGLLKARLESIGETVVEVSEPPVPYLALQRTWLDSTKSSEAHPEERTFLLLASRCRLAREVICPALQSGKVVISSRSYVSTLVYQRNEVLTDELVALCHSFMPPLDLLLLLDSSPQEAMRRLEERSLRTGSALSQYERMDLLEQHRAGFLGVVRRFLPPRVAKIVPQGTADETAAAVWSYVDELVCGAATAAERGDLTL